MKILVTTDQWSPDVIGGSARVAADTARALARRGHQVVAVTPAQPGLPAVEIEPDSGVEVRRVLRRGPIPQTFADPAETFRELRELRHRSFDVVLAHQTTNAVGAALARLRVPLAFVFHASVVLELDYLRRRAPWSRRVALSALGPTVTLLERVALRRASGILVLSRYSEKLVHARLRCAAERVHVVGGGVPDAFFVKVDRQDNRRRRYGIPPGTLLLTARRLEPRMGLENLISAVHLLSETPVVLAIAGDGSLRAQLDFEVRRLELDGRVHLLGRVSDDELRELYALADLFVLPSDAYEGFGMSTIEALAAGTPVLGTAVGATPEIVSKLDAELIVRSPNAASLAAGVRSALPKLGPKLRERARQLAEQEYRWESAIVRWESALHEIAFVDGHPRAANL